MKIKQQKDKDGKDVIVIERELSGEEKEADLEARMADLEKKSFSIRTGFKSKEAGVNLLFIYA